MNEIKFEKIEIKNEVLKKINIYYAGTEYITKEDISYSIGILRVRGNYPWGSKGSLIGENLRGISTYIRELYILDALLLDLSELEYEWGNNLLGIAQPQTVDTKKGEDWLGYYIIGSKENKHALETLFLEFGKSSKVKKIYTDLNTALKEIKSQLELIK